MPTTRCHDDDVGDSGGPTLGHVIRGFGFDPDQVIYTAAAAEKAAVTSSHLFPFLLLQTGRSENVVQGLSLRGGYVGVPEVHHEDHPGPVVCGA